MRVLVSGSTGLVGTLLVRELERAGHGVVRLVRREPAANEVRWDIPGGLLDPADLAGVEAVVHLAGEGIASGRWTEDKKERIRNSRVQGTALLCRTLLDMPKPPAVLVSASAIGYYGDRGGEVVNENSHPGEGFLPDVCAAWETATDCVLACGTRVVIARVGVVLSTLGGALQRMLTPFRLGVGGVIGSGEQYMSWIAHDDVVGALLHLLDDKDVSGPVNLVAPTPVTNREFTKTLGRVLRRPTLLPMPAFAARMAFGEMADALLLASTRVEPMQLQDSNFTFRHPDLEGALRHVLGR